MDSSKKISVCLPFYNIEPYVMRCLDSVLGNTYQNLEVICVNDGSTDGTSTLLHEYAEKDSRVIVIDQKKRRCCLGKKCSNRCGNRRFYFVRRWRRLDPSSVL